MNCLIILVLNIFNPYLYLIECTVKLDCGYPADIDGGLIKIMDQDNVLQHIDGKSFQHNTKIFYECHGNDSILIGDQYRQCLNGRWIGKTGKYPICAIDFQHGLKSIIEVFDLESNDIISKELDALYGFKWWSGNDSENCMTWNTTKEQLWKLTLTSSNNGSMDQVHYFVLGFYGQNLKQFMDTGHITLNLSLYSDTNRINCRNYISSDINFNLKLQQRIDFNSNYLLLSYICDDNRMKDRIKQITIEFKQQNQSHGITYISLCELKRYNFPEVCEEPDKPLNGVLANQDQIDNLTVYRIMCERSYILNGSEQLRCNQFGEWLDLSPVCIPEFCDKPLINLTDNNLVYQMSNVQMDMIKKNLDENPHKFKLITFSCKNQDKTEYILDGKSSYLCENGQWQGLDFNNLPICKKLSMQSETGSQLSVLFFTIPLVIVIVIILFVWHSIKVREYRHRTEQVQLNNLNPDNLYDDLDNSFSNETEFNSNYCEIDYESIQSPESNIYLVMLANSRSNFGSIDELKSFKQ